MSAKLLPFVSGLATALLAWGYSSGEFWAWVGVVLVLGVLWLVGGWRRLRWVSSAALFLYAGLAAGGVLAGLPAGWMAGGLVVALVAWDLDAFIGRLGAAGRVEGRRDLERRHLLRLIVVAGLGLALALVALGVRIQLGFAAAVLLGLIAAWGLGRVVRFLRREVG